MKKVLVISTVNLTMDGIVNVLKNYYSRIDKEQFNTEFVFPSVLNEALYNEFLTFGKVHIIPRSIKKLLAYIFRLYKLIKKNKYDIVHIHGNSATMTFELLAAALAGVKVRIAHSHNSTCSSKLVHCVLNPLFQRLYTGSFACGKKAGEWLFGLRSFKVISNGVDLSRFKFSEDVRDSLRIKLNLQDKTVIGHIGAFNLQKNQKFLIEVFEKLYLKNSNYHLLLVGDGSKRQEVEELVKEKGLTAAVTFAGVVSNSNEYYQAFDIFTLPSLYEGLPLVSVEAQAAGLPCIISDAVSREAGVTELVRFCGLNCPAEQWAESIHQIVCSDRDENSKQAVKALTAAGFDIVENVKSLETLYREMLAE